MISKSLVILVLPSILCNLKSFLVILKCLLMYKVFVELRNCSPGFSPNGISSVSSNGISAPASPNGISAVGANGGVFANQSRLNPQKQDGAQPKFSFSTSLPSGS